VTEEFFLRAVGIFLIALVRFSGFFINMPVFGEGVMPMRVKAGASALCAGIMLPHLLATQTLPMLSPLGYGLMAIRELTLGLTLGFVVMMMVGALKFAGAVVGMKVGFAFVQVTDPMSNRTQAMLSDFFQLTGTLLFLMLGGHILMLQAFAQSFDIVPLNGMVVGESAVELISSMSAMVFLTGLKISMPFIAIILVSDVGLGIIARTVPRMNVFQVGFALKVIMGIFIITLILPHFGDLIRVMTHQAFGDINTLLGLMSGR
jgi:flagellar biosynthesis protein FliR